MEIFGKKTAMSLILSVILIGGAFLLSKNSPEKADGPSIVSEKASFAVSDIDTDKDGLKDWEERLWKTDAKNPDTDGDGATDGEEVDADRDPLLAGPNDLLSANKKSIISVEDILSQNKDSATDALGRSLFAEYLNLKTSGDVLSSKDQAEIVGAVLQNASEGIEPTVFDYNSLSIIPGSDVTTLKRYGNDFANALAKYSATGEGELAYVARALSENDPSYLENLDPIIIEVEAVTSALLSVKVPSGISGSHLSFINEMSALRTDLSLMKKVLSDPVLGLLAISNYQNDSEELSVSFEKIKAYVKASGAVFSSTDAGYKFFK